MKRKNKGLIIFAVALLTMAFLFPTYAKSQSGIMKCPRDQTNEDPSGPTTRAYGEDPPVQAQEEKLEELTEETQSTSIKTQTQEQLRDCNCETEDSEQHQYQYQYQQGYGKED